MPVIPLLLPGIVVMASLSSEPSVRRSADDAAPASARAGGPACRPGAPLATGALPLTEGSTRMDEPMETRPEYAWLRQFKDAHGWKLMQRYGAHGLGIGWKREKGRKTDQLALIFYVDRRRVSPQAGAPPIPPAFTFTPEGSNASVELPTDVVETPAATLETE
jgi:hypothetical protein